MRLKNEQYYQVAQFVESIATDGEIDSWPVDIAAKVKEELSLPVSADQVRKAAGMAGVTIRRKEWVTASNNERAARKDVGDLHQALLDQYQTMVDGSTNMEVRIFNVTVMQEKILYLLQLITKELEISTDNENSN